MTILKVIVPILLFAAWQMPLVQPAAAKTPYIQNNLPQFSWKHVPVWADFCAPRGFNAGEEKFIAAHFSGLDIEGG